MSPMRHMFPRLPHPESLYLALTYLWQEQQLKLVIDLHCGPENYLYFFCSNYIPDVLLHLVSVQREPYSQLPA